VSVTRSLVLCVCFVDHCLSFFFWPLCCLFFDLRILIYERVRLIIICHKQFVALYYKYVITIYTMFVICYKDCTETHNKMSIHLHIKHRIRSTFVSNHWNETM
jgi:hypothetical protein